MFLPHFNTFRLFLHIARIECASFKGGIQMHRWPVFGYQQSQFMYTLSCCGELTPFCRLPKYVGLHLAYSWISICLHYIVCSMLLPLQVQTSRVIWFYTRFVWKILPQLDQQLEHFFVSFFCFAFAQAINSKRFRFFCGPNRMSAKSFAAMQSVKVNN